MIPALKRSSREAELFVGTDETKMSSVFKDAATKGCQQKRMKRWANGDLGLKI